jgi:hypothetical protein
MYKKQIDTSRTSAMVAGSFERRFDHIKGPGRVFGPLGMAALTLLLAIVVPLAIYKSFAGGSFVSVEPETGAINNTSLVSKVADSTASNSTYVRFNMPAYPAGQYGTFPSCAPTPKILWGMGDELGGMESTPLYQNGGVNMVTAWYNGPGDLSWMSGISRSSVDAYYAQGKSIQLIIWLANDTQYAISDQFVNTDLPKLINIFKGNGPLYIVLYTELETYYDKSTPAGLAYRDSLKTAYLKDLTTIHSLTPNAKGCLGFLGQFWYPGPTRDFSYWENGNGAGTHNTSTDANAMTASDMLCSQEMQSALTKDPSGNSIIVDQIRNGVAQFSQYHKPIMISHFKVWDDPKPINQASKDNSVASFGTVVNSLFTNAQLAQLKSQGLFAWGFMSDSYINQPGTVYNQASSFVHDHASSGATPFP